MPRNGAGEYNLPSDTNPVVTDTTITTDWANGTMEDIAAALTDSLSTDGQTSPVANLTMAGFHHVNVSNPTQLNQYVTLGMVQDNTAFRVELSSGVNNLVGTLVGGATSYAVGAVLGLYPLAVNTGPVTLDYNGIGALSFLTNTGDQLVAGDLQVGFNYLFEYTGAFFIVINAVASQGSLAFSQATATGQVRPASGSYPALSLASGTSVNVPAGTGVIIPPGNKGFEETETISWSASVVILTYVVSAFTTTIAISSSGTVTQFSGKIPPSSLRDYIVLGVVTHVAGTATAVTTSPNVYGDMSYVTVDMTSILSGILLSGGVVTANSTSLLSIDVTSGLISALGGSADNVDSPNTLALSGGNAINFRPLAGQSTLQTITNIAPVGFYDPNGSGTVTALSAAGDCTVHRLYYLYGEYIWVYGQQVYGSVSIALNYMDVDDSKYIPSLRISGACLLAKIVSTKTNTSLSSVNAAIITLGGLSYGIGTVGGIADAPSDGNTYGRRNATWVTIISAANPQVTGDVVVTKSNPRVVLNDSPVVAGYGGIAVQQAGVNWFTIETTYPDDKTYFRSYNPVGGALRYSTLYNLANGSWSFPANISAIGDLQNTDITGTCSINITGSVTATGNIQAATFNGSALGNAAYGTVQTAWTDTTVGRIKKIYSNPTIAGYDLNSSSLNALDTMIAVSAPLSTNIPPPNDTGWCRIFSDSTNNYRAQMYHSLTNDTVWYRLLPGTGVWGAWAQFLLSDDGGATYTISGNSTLTASPPQGDNTTKIATMANVRATYNRRTWYNRTSVRALSTNYTNSSGDEMEIVVTGLCGGTGSSSTIVVTVNGDVRLQNSAASTTRTSATITLANGDVYSVSYLTATLTIVSWWEFSA